MPPVFFFNGTDPAPSETQRSDDGATVVLAATPRQPLGANDPLPVLECDWQLDYVYARVFTAKHRLNAGQWSGFLHALHRRYGFTRMVVDAGAGGGGIFVKRELIKAKQLIDGQEVAVVPICDQTVESQQAVVSAQFILSMFKRGDPGIDAVWPDPTGSKALSGDDLLKDALYAAYRGALTQGILHWPPAAEDYLREHPDTEPAWGEERVWALRNLETGTKQLCNIVVETTEKDGEQVQVHTARGARKFSTLGKDDIALAMMYAYAAFRVWLQGGEGERPPDEDMTGFAGS